MENDYFEEIYLLVADILQKHIPIDDVKNRINVLSMKYGEGIFPEIIFAKRERPWNDEYLCELKRMNITGACSKDFLLHMAEVSRYLYEKKRNLFVFGFIVCLIILVVILGVVI